ncbi:MAG TPA: carboxypeptidase-like regulatory domain-containing protein [Gemmataceae bacterium]|nr:carboxypeptidase-like regulatory domain-containing protein [Gemmataceae bacterium]
MLSPGKYLQILCASVIFITNSPAFALILGGEGNSPVADPGWPKGAAAIFNVKARIAYWEGPPFGGGQWHAECRGNATALNAVLVDFAKLDVKNKRLVVHDGAGKSFWLNPNGQADKQDKAKMDWMFMVWVPANWEHLRKLPADLNPTDPEEAKSGPPSQIDIYTGGNIKWADVKVPEGIKVIDNRLEAHGFSTGDGIVLEGKVTDLVTQKPIVAKVRLERVEPQKTGGYQYPAVAEATSDDEGHWAIKKAPSGWVRAVVVADGYVPRVAGYARYDDQPHWQEFTTGLARAATVAGRITDSDGKPLADADVHLMDVVTSPGGRYETTNDYRVKTDAEGRFRMVQVPAGKANVWVHKPGYCRPGLGLPITTPKEDIALTMMKSTQVIVTIDFTGMKRPAGYMVSIAPVGGEKIGSYGGSGNINDKNQMTFDNVPPGKYVLKGRPNPGADKEETDAATVDLKGGETVHVKLTAK